MAAAAAAAVGSYLSLLSHLPPLISFLPSCALPIFIMLPLCIEYIYISLKSAHAACQNAIGIKWSGACSEGEGGDDREKETEKGKIGWRSKSMRT